MAGLHSNCLRKCQGVLLSGSHIFGIRPPEAELESSSSFTSSPATGTVTAFPTGHSNRGVVASCGFDLIYLMISDAGLLFICLPSLRTVCPHLLYCMFSEGPAKLRHSEVSGIKLLPSFFSLSLSFHYLTRFDLFVGSCSIFFFFFWLRPGHAEVLGQGSNLHQSSDPSHSSDDAGHLTHRATRELSPVFSS